jgi:ABC-2 type transport system ATP-binding protein
MTPTVALAGVTKSFDRVVAVDGLSFEIPAGQIFGLLGPNGAGKTSTIRMMIGITIPDAGLLRLFGESLSRKLLERVGYLPEERGLYRRMSVIDNLIFLGELKGLSRSDAIAASRSLASRLDIGDWLPRKVEELSKGMQQKVQFIAALLGEPEFVIMDEPFSGLDPIATNELKDILVEFKRAGRTILFSTHRMDQVEKLCDSICLINHGRAVLSGDLGEIKARASKHYVQIECAGGAEFLKDSPLVASFRSFGSYAEVGLRNGADTQEILKQSIAHGRILRFEVMQPSLEQIFIDIVGKSS